MHTLQAVNLDPAGARRAMASPHAVLILPELRPKRVEGLGILILADGNRRHSPEGGYARGAGRVVSIAEHLARRPDVATMVACILSPENIAKRGGAFFLELQREFVQLGAEIQERGALVAHGVRMEVNGDLGSLRARGGHAIALADAIEAAVRLTACVAKPALRLVLGVGYRPDAARELDVDLILRTGMEEPGVLRLSGLRTGERIANCAITTLWPSVQPGEVDEIIELCKRSAVPRFARGHDAAAVVELARALTKAGAGEPLAVTVPASSPRAELAVALERLFMGPLRSSPIAVELAGDEVQAPRRYGRGEKTALHVVLGEPAAGPELHSVLAPGQRAPLFTLPDWLRLGHANVHGCGTDAREMVEAICAARRFSVDHPALLGRDRPTAHPARTDRDDEADRFVEKSLAWAAVAGLLPPGEAWLTAARNYALTAFIVHFGIPTEWDPAGISWEERADLAARYMLLVAAGDEGIFDRVFPGESPDERWARLACSSRFLRSALGPERARPPSVPGAELLVAIAEQWRELFGRYRGTSLDAAAGSFEAGLDSLYAASLAEHRAGLADAPDVATLIAAIEERLAGAPPCVVARARALAGRSSELAPADALELRALLHLAEVSGSVGAGLLFQSAALAAPAPVVTHREIAALDATAKILDYAVRLANDVSSFRDSAGGDRDPKENVCTILAPGRAGTAAAAGAMAACGELAAWLEAELADHIDRVAEVWPSMGVALRRGTLVGRRVYEVGHYTTVSRAQMSAIFAEVEQSHEQRAGETRLSGYVNTQIPEWPGNGVG